MLPVVSKAKKETFGQRIKRLRDEGGITQTALAAHCEITGGYLSRVESDAHDPPGEPVICAMAAMLQVPADELLMLAGRLPSDVVEWLLADPARLAAVRARMKGARR